MLNVQQRNAELRQAELLAAMEKPLNRAISTPPREVPDQRCCVRFWWWLSFDDTVNIFWLICTPRMAFFGWTIREFRVSDHWFHILLLEDYAAFLEESEMAHAARCRAKTFQGLRPFRVPTCLGVGDLRSLAQEVALGESRLEDQEAHNGLGRSNGENLVLSFLQKRFLHAICPIDFPPRERFGESIRRCWCVPGRDPTSHGAALSPPGGARISGWHFATEVTSQTRQYAVRISHQKGPTPRNIQRAQTYVVAMAEIFFCDWFFFAGFSCRGCPRKVAEESIAKCLGDGKAGRISASEDFGASVWASRNTFHDLRGWWRRYYSFVSSIFRPSYWPRCQAVDCKASSGTAMFCFDSSPCIQRLFSCLNFCKQHRCVSMFYVCNVMMMQKVWWYAMVCNAL